MRHRLRVQDGDVFLPVRVQPRAARSELAGMLGGSLKVRLAAPPVDGAANAALLEFLAERLGCRRNTIELVQGHASRQKTVLIRGMSERAVRQALNLPPPEPD